MRIATLLVLTIIATTPLTATAIAIVITNPASAVIPISTALLVLLILSRRRLLMTSHSQSTESSAVLMSKLAGISSECLLVILLRLWGREPRLALRLTGHVVCRSRAIADLSQRRARTTSLRGIVTFRSIIISALLTTMLLSEGLLSKARRRTVEHIRHAAKSRVSSGLLSFRWLHRTSSTIVTLADRHALLIETSRVGWRR